jgi:hypothetical protein
MGEDKRIVLLFILLRGATLRSPPFYAAKIYKFATKITVLASNVNSLVFFKSKKAHF